MIRNRFLVRSSVLGLAAVLTLPSSLFGQAVTLPAMKSFVLDNGLKVIVVENHDQPAVLYTIMFKSGTLDDKKGKEGETELLGRLLERGSKRYPAEKLAERIDYLGAEFGVEVSRDYLGIEMMVLAKDRLEGFDILSDIVMNPALDQAELELARKELTAEVKSAMDEPSLMAADYLRNLIFRDDPRGRTKTLASLSSIKREDLVDCHQRNLNPHKAVLAVIGDVDYDSLTRKVKDRLNPWTSKQGAVPSVTGATGDAAPDWIGEAFRIRLVDRPGLTQSFIALGFPSIRRNDPDHFAYLALNHILGGASFASRLMSVVRAKQGKTYSISSRFEAGAQPGPFMIRTFTQTGQTKEMVDLIVKVLTEMKEKGVTDEELTRMKTSQIGGYQLRFQTPEDLAREILTVERYDLGPEYLKTYPEKINALTIDEVNRAARRYLDAEGFSLVVVGDRATVDTIIKPLGRFETVPFEDLYTR